MYLRTIILKVIKFKFEFFLNGHYTIEYTATIECRIENFSSRYVRDRRQNLSATSTQQAEPWIYHHTDIPEPQSVP